MNGVSLFILPGFKMKATGPAFRGLRAYAKERGMRVVPVPVEWDRHTLTENASAFVAFYRKHRSARNYVLGFSYGAVLALVTAKELCPDRLFLCSLSPDFAEDKAAMPKGMERYIGKRRFADTDTRSARKSARGLLMPVTVFYGEKEGKQYPRLAHRCEETARLVKNGACISVPGAPHAIHFPAYAEAIRNELRAVRPGSR